jgi:transposase-like protein
MAKPYSVDLRERVIAAVEREGMSRRSAAQRFGVGISTVITWVRRFRETGSVAPGQMGGHKQKSIRDEHRVSASLADQGERLHPARSGRGAGRARAEGRLSDGLELRSRGAAELQKKPSSPANGIAPTSHVGGRNGASIRAALMLPAWSSSTRPGPRPTWLRSGDGRHAVCG